eukprot:CAMPEP_0119040986 /NCGR_PEP_ID=MMETSP1177-20130426/11062_1 /TAXON_ID=2985 /ORGANISM="Ochromonas sp, Strain CCMP1899" /LENGTH=835 /DNA_ID=CAMNT_0007006569 /DNA_START=160 /DNA_END=2667 /DNA_ORIENTATION=-
MKEIGDNKWDVYKLRISKELSVIIRNSHYVEVMTQAKREKTSSSSKQIEDAEVTRYLTKISLAKSSIISTFEELENENKDHRIWPQLSALGDESGMIDIDEVVCSRCGLDEMENDDILFCDRTGCSRAYHQNCLSPAVKGSPEESSEEDWFCWQCECVDDCLDLVNEQCETELNTWQELFPDLQAQESNTVVEDGILLDEEDDDESDDDDFNPEGNNANYQEDNFYSSDDSDNNSDGEECDDDDQDNNGICNDNDNDDSQNISNGAETAGGNDKSIRGEEERNHLDIDIGIDRNEVKMLLDEAGRNNFSDFRLVGGRRLRARISKIIARGTSYTIEGEKDVGKEVLKVKRGVVIIGKITSYSDPQNSKDGKITSYSDSQNSKDGTLSSQLHIGSLSSPSATSIAPPPLHPPSPSSSSGMHRNVLKSVLTDEKESSSSSSSSSSPTPTPNPNPSTSPSSSSDRLLESSKEPSYYKESFSSSSLSPLERLKNILPEKNLESSYLSSSAFGHPFSLYPSQSSPSQVTSILPRDSPSLPLPSPNRIKKEFHQDICSNEREDSSSLISISGSIISDINKENTNNDDDNNLEVNIPFERNGDNINKKRGNDHIQADCISGVNTNIIRDNLDTNTDVDIKKDVSWSIEYDDGSMAVLNYEELRRAFKDVEEYMVVKHKLEGRVVAFNEDDEEDITTEGAFDDSNVLLHKRARKSIDYAKLSLQIFGSVEDDDPEATMDDHDMDSMIEEEALPDGEYNSEEDSIKTKKKSKYQKKNPKYSKNLKNFKNSKKNKFDTSLSDEKNSSDYVKNCIDRKRKRKDKAAPSVDIASIEVLPIENVGDVL